MTGSSLPRELHHEGARRVRVEIGAGLVEVGASPDEATHVLVDVRKDDDAARELVAGTRLAIVGDEIVVESPRRSDWQMPQILVRVAAPPALTYRIKAGSADVDAVADLADARVVTGSGDIRVVRVTGRFDARAGSGDIRVGTATGAVSLATGTGEIEVSSAAGPLAASTGSGDVRIGEATGPTRVKVGSGDITIERVRNHSVATSGSGDVRVETAHGPSLVAESARGDVHVGVPDGTPAYLNLKTITGEIRCDLEPAEQPAEGTPTLALRARTVSGDITVERV